MRNPEFAASPHSPTPPSPHGGGPGLPGVKPAARDAHSRRAVRGLCCVTIRVADGCVDPHIGDSQGQTHRLLLQSSTHH